MSNPQTAVWNIKALAEEKNIENAHALVVQSGAGVSYPRMLKIWDGDGNLSASELDFLAKFFKCSVGKLITHTR